MWCLLAAASEGAQRTTAETVMWFYLPTQSLITGLIWWTVRKLGRDQTVIKGMEGRLLEQAMAKIEQQHAAAMDLLDERHALTTKLLDERFRRISHDVEQGAQKTRAEIDDVMARLNHTTSKIEATSEKLGEKAHGLDIKLLTEIGRVQREVAEKAATKDDLRRHEESMSRRMDDVLRKCVQ